MAYEELATVREIVDLSPQEALGSAEGFLTQQGYALVRRTDNSLTVQRHPPDGATGQNAPSLTVEALPQPGGGVCIKVRGNDRDGVQEQQAAWIEWSDGLPKKELQKRDDGGITRENEPEDRSPSSGLEAQSDAARRESARLAPGRQQDSELRAGFSEEFGSREGELTFSEGRAKRGGVAITYEYKMVQIPPTISVRARDHVGDEAAQYLQSIANEHSKQGWEFYRIDTISVAIPAGCLAGLFGNSGTLSQYYVVTFRRPA